MIKREVRAADQLATRPAVTSAGPDPGRGADRDGTGTSPRSGELLTLMKQLRDELNAFLADVETGREFSGNRDSSHGL